MKRFGLVVVAIFFCVNSVAGNVDLFTAALTPGDFDLAKLTEEIVTEGPVNPVKPNIKVLSLHVATDIQYRYAVTRVTSRVANHDNVSREVVFSLVVPESAFVSKFFMEIKNRTYDAYIREKEEAKQEYEQAVASGQAAAHVELRARDSNTFRVSVNVEPQTKVNFGMSYEQLLARTLGRYEHVVNVNPGQLVKNMTVTVNILESSNITDLEVPELKTSNEITDEKETPNKLAEIVRSGNTATVRWEPSLEEQEKINKDVGAKGQLVVRYDVDRSSNSDQILVDEGYFVHFYAPPNLPTLDKHVIFVLDLSGSMFGTKLSQLKDAMVEILGDLRERDFFSIILFSNKAHVWSLNSSNETLVMLNEDAPPQNLTFQDHVIPVNQDNIARAKEAIKEMQDHGGTNIIDGLRKAIEMAQVGRESFANKLEMPEPIIIFLTDGEPNVEMSSTEEIIKTVDQLNKNKNQIFSLAFGNGADYNFLRKLSLANAAFARNIYEASDAALQLRNFYKQVASPLLSNVTFNYLPGQVEGTTKTQFSTLYSGSELVVAGKINQKDELKRLSGNVAGRSVNGSEAFEFPELHNVQNETYAAHCGNDFIPIELFVDENRTHGHLERAWAYLYVQQLLDENSLDEAKINASKAKALHISLEYSFVTPLTSLVVVKPNDTGKAIESTKSPSGEEPGHYDVARSAGRLRLGKSRYHNRGSFLTKKSKAAKSNSKQVQMYKVGMSSSNAMGYQPAALSASSMSAPGYVGYAMPHAAYFAQKGSLMPMSAPPPPFMFPQPMTDVIRLQHTTVENQVILEDENQYYATKTLTPDMKLAFENFARIHNLSLAQDSEVTDASYQECANSSSPSFSSPTSHHCKHLVTCILSDITLDMNTYEPYHCVIDSKYLGVCCPDGIRRPNQIGNSTATNLENDMLNGTTDYSTGGNLQNDAFIGTTSVPEIIDPSKSAKPTDLSTTENAKIAASGAAIPEKSTATSPISAPAPAPNAA